MKYNLKSNCLFLVLVHQYNLFIDNLTTWHHPRCLFIRWIPKWTSPSKWTTDGPADPPTKALTTCSLAMPAEAMRAAASRWRLCAVATRWPLRSATCRRWAKWAMLTASRRWSTTRWRLWSNCVRSTRSFVDCHYRTSSWVTVISRNNLLIIRAADTIISHHPLRPNQVIVTPRLEIEIVFHWTNLSRWQHWRSDNCSW